MVKCINDNLSERSTSKDGVVGLLLLGTLGYGSDRGSDGIASEYASDDLSWQDNNKHDIS